MVVVVMMISNTAMVAVELSFDRLISCQIKIIEWSCAWIVSPTSIPKRSPIMSATHHFGVQWILDILLHVAQTIFNDKMQVATHITPHRPNHLLLSIKQFPNRKLWSSCDFNEWPIKWIKSIHLLENKPDSYDKWLEIWEMNLYLHLASWNSGANEQWTANSSETS